MKANEKVCFLVLNLSFDIRNYINQVISTKYCSTDSEMCADKPHRLSDVQTMIALWVKIYPKK